MFTADPLSSRTIVSAHLTLMQAIIPSLRTNYLFLSLIKIQDTKFTVQNHLFPFLYQEFLYSLSRGKIHLKIKLYYSQTTDNIYSKRKHKI